MQATKSIEIDWTQINKFIRSNYGDWLTFIDARVAMDTVEKDFNCKIEFGIDAKPATFTFQNEQEALLFKLRFL